VTAKMNFQHQPDWEIILILFGAQETFLIVINVENNILVETLILSFRILWWKKSSKECWIKVLISLKDSHWLKYF